MVYPERHGCDEYVDDMVYNGRPVCVEINVV